MDHLFSTQTKEVIAKSRDVAIELRTPYISSLHFFLADCLLFGERSALGFAFTSIDHFVKYYNDFKAAQELNVPHYAPPESLPLTREAEQVIKNSYKDQLQQKHPEITPLHLMLAAVKQADSEFVNLLHPKDDLYNKLVTFYMQKGLLKEAPGSLTDRVKGFFSSSPKLTNTQPVSILPPTMPKATPPVFSNVSREGAEKVEMILKGVSEGQKEQTYAVVFEEKNGSRRMAVIIGAFEAQALSVALEKMEASRPLTHHLFRDTIIATGFSVKESFVHSMKDGIFHACISLTHAERTIEQDSRPSDAFIMATLFNAPIYFNDKVLELVKM